MYNFYNYDEWIYPTEIDPILEQKLSECKSDEERNAVCMMYAFWNILAYMAFPILFCIGYALYKLIF